MSTVSCKGSKLIEESIDAIYAAIIFKMLLILQFHGGVPQRPLGARNQTVFAC